MSALLRVGLAGLLSLLTLLSGPLQAQASLLHLVGPVPEDLGVHDGNLAACDSPAHCSRTTWAISDPAAALGALRAELERTEGIEVKEATEGYLHATATSRLFGFVDDLELLAVPGAGTLEARSVSRLGDSDLGVNARRLERLRGSLPQT